MQQNNYGLKLRMFSAASQDWSYLQVLLIAPKNYETICMQLKIGDYHGIYTIARNGLVDLLQWSDGCCSY